MSLETQIAALIKTVSDQNDTVAGQAAAINAAKNAAVNAVPNIETNHWLDQISGNDSSDGSELFPFKTLSKVLSVGKAGGVQTIRVYGDLNMTDEIYTKAKNTHVHFESVARKADGSNYAIKPAIVEIPSAPGTYRITMLSSIHSKLSFSSNFLNIEFPTNTNNRTLVSEYLFNSRGLGNLNMQYNMYNGTIISSGRVGKIFSARGLKSIGLYLFSTTYDSTMAGRWIDGVAAGKLPTDYVDVLSNVASF